jgi:diguanylate cyclase
LSGLLNRSHWEKLVRAEFARYARSSDPAVLVLADLDHFKRLNDTYGHTVGDDAIRRFAKALKRVLRETDICGRYGGEEFGILLPGTDTAAAREVIERLRRDLHENPMLEGVVVTASFGMVELHREITSVEEWLRVVDKMLYQAKHLGRDRVVELTELTNSALASLEVLPPRQASRRRGA